MKIQTIALRNIISHCSITPVDADCNEKLGREKRGKDCRFIQYSNVAFYN